MSAQSLGVAGIALVIGIGLGIVAAAMGGHFGTWWPWISILVVVLIVGLMTPTAGKPMRQLRTALGQPDGQRRDAPAPTPASDAGLAAAQARLRPEFAAAIGLAGTLVLVRLMEAKPF